MSIMRPSAYAQPAIPCRHNLELLALRRSSGIGPDPLRNSLLDRVLRQMRWKHPDAYLAHVASGTPIQENRRGCERLPFEFLMDALRLADGSLPRTESRTATRVAALLPRLRAAADKPVDPLRRSVVPTPRGRRYLNILLERFRTSVLIQVGDSHSPPADQVLARCGRKKQPATASGSGEQRGAGLEADQPEIAADVLRQRKNKAPRNPGKASRLQPNCVHSKLLF